MHSGAAQREYRVEIDGAAVPSRGRYGAAIAQSTSAADGRVRERMHASSSVGAVLSGYFEFHTPAGNALVGPGALIFGNANEMFSYRYLGGAGARRCVVALSDELMQEAFDYYGEDLARFKFAALAPRRATTALYALVRAITVSRASLDDAVIELVNASMTAGREASPRAASPRVRHRMHKLARFIDASYAQPLRLTDLAAMARLSRFHFLRAFKAEVGDTPSRYLMAARLRAAVDQLLDTRAPIAQIALAVGFNDVSHFNAMFRATFGVSPRVWRTHV